MRCVCNFSQFLQDPGYFLLLKTPVLYHKKVHVNNKIFTCCALHNQLHAWDQREQWENEMEWGAADGLFEDDPDANYAKPTIRACSGSGSSESSIGCMSFNSVDVCGSCGVIEESSPLRREVRLTVNTRFREPARRS